MYNNAIKTLLSGRRYLLLQGPMGPFFSDLASWLEAHGREAINVVFNGGDRFYCASRPYLPFHGPAAAFPEWLTALQQDYAFDTVLCFGDCRPLHQAARRWADTHGVRFLAFEEGYLRPHYITVEKGGVNGYSPLPRDPDFYRQLGEMPERNIEHLASSGLKRIWHATVYYLAGRFFRRDFPHYRHHKNFSPWYEARCWWRAFWRKHYYRLRQSGIRRRLCREYDRHFHLAVLQVFNDSQIKNHSPYHDIRDYIEELIVSFARHGAPEQRLVFKHHPMDRGHRLYAPLIARLGKEHGISDRLLYVHDVSLPELLSHCRSVVTINSTVGISALIHNRPLKVMGRAFYDMPGLTWQHSLDSFWQSDCQPDRELFKKFRAYMFENSQINTVYYRKGKRQKNNPAWALKTWLQESPGRQKNGKKAS